MRLRLELLCRRWSLCGHFFISFLNCRLLPVSCRSPASSFSSPEQQQHQTGNHSVSHTEKFCFRFLAYYWFAPASQPMTANHRLQLSVRLVVQYPADLVACFTQFQRSISWFPSNFSDKLCQRSHIHVYTPCTPSCIHVYVQVNTFNRGGGTQCALAGAHVETLPGAPSYINALQ